MASGNLKDYLGFGAITSRPTTPDLFTDTAGYWYATDTGVLSIWDGSAWEDVTNATGVPEAPIDGQTYGRKDADWEAITSGGSSYAYMTTQITATTTASSSAFATKGNIFVCDEDCAVRGWAARINTAGTYAAYLLELDASNVITAVLETSPGQVISTVPAIYSWTLGSTVAITAGTRIATAIVRTDGTGTTIAGVSFPGVAATAAPLGMTVINGFTLASNPPAVSDTCTVANPSSIYMSLASGVKVS